MKILVTGGAGFIGSNLTHQLVALGGDVLVVDNLSQGESSDLHPGAAFRKLDVCDETFIDLACEYQPDVIVHLAIDPDMQRAGADSKSSCGADSAGGADSADGANLEGVRMAARATLECGAERLVFTSCAAVYGEAEESALPLRECDPTNPTSPLGISKLASEKLIENMLRPAGVDFAILRLSHVYGPRQTAKRNNGGVRPKSQSVGDAGSSDVSDAPDTPVVARFLNRALENRALEIYGDGTQGRDFLFVSDVVMGLVSCIGGEIRFSDQFSGIYNLSTGQLSSIDFLARSVQRTTRNFEPFDYLPQREGDVQRSALSFEKALKVFEWAPQVELPVGLEKTWNWFASQKKF